MKNIILCILLTLSFSVQAQYDTVPYNVNLPWFLLNNPYDSIRVTTHDGVYCTPWFASLNDIDPTAPGSGTGVRLFDEYEFPEGDIAWGFRFDSTIHLIGIAFFYSGGWQPGGIMWDTIDYDSLLVRVYTPLGDNMSLSRIASMDKMEMTNYNRLYFMFMGWGPVEYSWWNVDGYGGGTPIREIYFDNEIDISDSLYVSARYRKTHPNSYYWVDRTIGFVEKHQSNVTDARIYPIQSYRIKQCEDCPWFYGEQHSYPQMALIIRRDCDSCPQVRGMQHIKAAANKAIFKWQRGTNHHDWQLSYGPAGTAPEAGTIVDVNQVISNSITFDPDSHYVAYVRARCRFARYEYGPWSDPYTFSINGGNGIDDVSSNDVTLTPNPAAERVTVSAEGMQSVELLGVDGTVIMRREGLMQDKYILDLKGLAAGVYMVRVSTAKGTATRRLMVQ